MCELLIHAATPFAINTSFQSMPSGACKNDTFQPVALALSANAFPASRPAQSPSVAIIRSWGFWGKMHDRIPDALSAAQTRKGRGKIPDAREKAPFDTFADHKRPCGVRQTNTPKHHFIWGYVCFALSVWTQICPVNCETFATLNQCNHCGLFCFGMPVITLGKVSQRRCVRWRYYPP